MSARIRSLTADAVRCRPKWTALLGDVPAASVQYEEWLHHIGVIAAYRDEYQIATDDSSQVLGPYPEPGHAGHKAYWHAAESIFSARVLAGLESETPHHPVSARVASDVYLSLPEQERQAANKAIAQRLGMLSFGAHGKIDDLDAYQPIFANQLAVVLKERGHLVDAGLLKGNWKMSTELERPLESRLVEQRARRQAEPATKPRRALPPRTDRWQAALNRHGQPRRTDTSQTVEDFQDAHVKRNSPNWGQQQQPHPRS